MLLSMGLQKAGTTTKKKKNSGRIVQVSIFIGAENCDRWLRAETREGPPPTGIQGGEFAGDV